MRREHGYEPGEFGLKRWSPFPDPAWLCSIPYHAAVRELGRRVAAVDGVRALVSRNSYADRTHWPGISDLDLVVVLEDDLGEARGSVVEGWTGSSHRCSAGGSLLPFRTPGDGAAARPGASRAHSRLVSWMDSLDRVPMADR